MKNPAVLLIITALISAFTAGYVFAALTSQSLNVSVSVQGTCSISTRDISFPNYSIASAEAVRGTGSILTECNSGLNYSIEIDSGLNSSGSQRQMSDGGTGRLLYKLCQDSGCQTPWGDDSPLGNPFTGSGSGSQQDITVYGEILPNQSVPAGNYSDTVTCTIKW